MTTIFAICNFTCLFCAAISIYLSIKLFCRGRELRRVTMELEKLERLYGAMALELQNMTDSIMLEDVEGAKIFYNKIHKLHKQFMNVGTNKGDM
jgi:hypothetical protein